MRKLTARQNEVLNVIRAYIDETGFPPTRVDIAKELGFRSANASEEHLKALAKKGAIEMVPGTSRGIRIPDDKGLPVVGRVAAGDPILAEEHIEDYCDISPNFFRPSADYLLLVRGNSMKDCGILDGDLLAVHRTAEVNNGDIVVARLGDEVTVKRLKRHRSKYRITLMPENEDYEPIEIDLRNDELVFEGLGVGVLRH